MLRSVVTSRSGVIHNIIKRKFTTSRINLGDVEVTVDGVKVSIEAGSSIIQAAEKAGVTIPRYCYHEKLAIAGNCRMCLVEVERSPKMAASCAMPVMNGMVIKTDTDKIKKAREGVTEMLLENHPLDCPVCDQGGECDLQEQSQRYGSDRGRFNEISGKRAVENKAIGPLIKTSMNRCIHCTRCVRFLNDVAGASEFGTAGRGNDMQIGTYVERNVNSELSGNIIDLCPVGALTSKPYAFKARPWELKRTESIDVLDGLGSAIRVDARGPEVMRILPRLNDEVNDEWISDKTRFAYDGLKTQRLTKPLIRNNKSFVDATWEEALVTIASKFKEMNVVENELKAYAGALADVESMVALKDLVNRLGSENLSLDIPSHEIPPAHGVDFRSNYVFNSKVDGIDEADTILLVGTNPRHEAAVLNAKIRAKWLRSELEIFHVGEEFNSTFNMNHVGTSAKDLESALKGKLGKQLTSSSKPLIIVGSGVVESADGSSIYSMLSSFVKDKPNFLNEHWNGFNVLQREASRAGALDIGFTCQSGEVVATKPKFIFLLGADEINEADIPFDSFVVYIGHHGEIGASYADVILPSAAYTEKNATFVNTEGRVQTTRAATSPPGAAREDWTIIKALSEFMGVPLPYENLFQMRTRLAEISPHLLRHDVVEPVSEQIAKLGLTSLIQPGVKPIGATLKNPIDNFYFTDVISRNSPTMARCVGSFGGKIDKINDPNAQMYLGLA